MRYSGPGAPHRCAGNGRARALDQKLTQLTQALALLTDAMESGFSAVTTEMHRASAPAPAQTPKVRSLTRRLARAAGGGHPIHEIAAREQMSEGEVRLRINLSNGGGAEVTDFSEDSPDGPMRA